MQEKLSKAAAQLGRKGGKATYKKKGKKFMSEIGKKGMESRWKNKKNNS